MHFKSVTFISQGMYRHIQARIDEALSLFPCVALLGVRQCGKTTLLNNLPKNWKQYDMEKTSDRELLLRDPDLFFRMNSQQVAIDEAQMVPELFPALRVAIDDDRKSPGRFIITGSSSPDLSRKISETLAGRIAILELSPFSIAEAYNFPISDLFLQSFTNYEAMDTNRHPTRFTLQQILTYWEKGGYPEPWIKKNDRFHDLWMTNYFDNYLNRDLAGLFPKLNRDKYRLFLQSLSQLSGTIINYSDLGRTLGLSAPTAREYLEIAHGTYVWRSLPAYEKNATKRIVKHPKGHFRDCGLLHHLWHISNQRDLLSHPLMGRSWESMIIENIIQGFQQTGLILQQYYYRTSAGAEIDLIIESSKGILPIEIKFTQKINGRDLRALKDFITERNCPIGWVVHNGERVEWLDDKILGIPATCL